LILSKRLDKNIRIDYNARSWAIEKPGRLGQPSPKTRQEAMCCLDLALKSPLILMKRALRED